MKYTHFTRAGRDDGRVKRLLLASYVETNFLKVNKKGKKLLYEIFMKTKLNEICLKMCEIRNLYS